MLIRKKEEKKKKLKSKNNNENEVNMEGLSTDITKFTILSKTSRLDFDRLSNPFESHPRRLLIPLTVGWNAKRPNVLLAVKCKRTGHMSGARAVRVWELGERTSGIKPFFRYVTPWPDRKRSFRGEAGFPGTMSSPPYTITINFQGDVIPAFNNAAQLELSLKFM